MMKQIVFTGNIIKLEERNNMNTENNYISVRNKFDCSLIDSLREQHHSNSNQFLLYIHDY
jgi:hypothetical protein